MSDEKKAKSETYGKARQAFDDLSMDERASFLVESVVGMMAEGVGQAGRVVSQVLDELGEKLDNLYEQEKEDKAGEKNGEPKARSAAGSSSGKKSTGSRRKKAADKEKEGGS